MVIMSKFDVIKVLAEDKQRFLDDAKDEFLKHHPDFEGMYISQSFLFRKILDHYIES